MPGLFHELKFSSSSICADGLRFLMFQHISYIFNSIFQGKVSSQEALTYMSQYCSSFDLFLKGLADLPPLHVLGQNPSNAKNLRAIAYQCIYLPLHFKSNPNPMDAKSIAALQIRGHQLLAAIFNIPGLNAATDLSFLSAIKISMNIFLFLQSQKAHPSIPFGQSAEALPVSERQAFIHAFLKSLSIVNDHFGKIVESHPESCSVLPEVAATLANMCTVVSDARFVELAGSLTHSCLQQIANTSAGIEKKQASMCCKSFNKLLSIPSCSDGFGVRGCSLLLLQIVLRTCSQSGPNTMSSLSLLQSTITGLHHVLLAEDIVMAAYKEGLGFGV